MIDALTVFVVDDDEAVRDSLTFLVESNGYTAKTYATAKEFIDSYHADEMPGCLLLDVRMPDMNGFELQRELHNRNITIPIIFISAHGTVPTAVRALKLGAVDFIMKPFNHVALLEKIEHALQIDKIGREAQCRKALIADRIATLTSREQDVMRLIVDGKSAKEIATLLGISNKTVDVHRSHIKEKLGIKSVAELVKMAVSLEPDYH
ncbi:MAG: response regulator [Gammaproteobacteria bacterium]|jgi:two-component system response regulator TtrR|nr:response regulator [Gammaproteobacteria bacterium]